MITLDAFLVFLAAASLPVIYVVILSRWVEPEDRKAHSDTASLKSPARLSEPYERAA